MWTTDAKPRIPGNSAPTRRPGRGGGAGYILLEAVVALMVLSIGVFAVQSSIRQASLTEAQTSDYTWARVLLQQLMSEVEMQPIIPVQTKSGTFGGQFARFSYTRKVSAVKIPMPPLPPVIPGIQFPGMPPGAPPLDAEVGPDGKPLVELKERFIGRLTATVRWQRAGANYEVTAETLFTPDKLWNPESMKPDGAQP